MIAAPALQGIALISEDVFYDDSMQDIYIPFWHLYRPRYPTVTTPILHRSICLKFDAAHFIKGFPYIKNLITDDEAIPHIFDAFQSAKRGVATETEWEDLEYVRLQPTRGASNPNVTNLKALSDWLAYRQDQGLPRVSPELLMDQRAMETVADYRKWVDMLKDRCMSTVVRSSSRMGDPWKYHVIPQRSKGVMGR